MPAFHLDGESVDFEPGEKVLSAALRAGKMIPHYCYHPGLSVVATCRMCLVDVVDMGNGRPAPKLQTACSMDASDGMKIETLNEKVDQGRKLVNEFLLVNHPLDCPVCDQAGECTLQDYAFEYGTGKSEMEYSKRVSGWRDIGTFVALERNRCVQCSRCDRFTREITGTNEFGMFNRAHELTMDTYADRPMVNKFQGNMADICPVGAITEKEFRFKRRVWKLKKNESICTGCSTGCNMTIEFDRNEVFRLKPRENQDVNKWWLCDEGRLTYREMNERKTRSHQPLLRKDGELQAADWDQVYWKIAEVLKEANLSGNEVIALASTKASNEELFLLKKMFKDIFSSENIFSPMPNWEQPESDFFINTLITTDRTPNRAGAEILGYQGDADQQKVNAALDNKIKLTVVLGDAFSEDSQIQEKVANSEFVVYIGAFQNAWCERADVVLPGQYYSEKEGTFTNKNKRVQRTESSVQALRRTRPDYQILAEMTESLGQKTGYETIADLFDAMTRNESGFAGIQYKDLGSTGTQLS